MARIFRCKVGDPNTGLVKGQQVVSFRSTEFIDDSARDNKATNEGEVSKHGWALGQIADMQAWWAGSQGKSATVSVTGYSLGGHLANAFNQLNGSQVDRVYTFNGAGVGSISMFSSLSDVLQTFTTYSAQGANAAQFRSSVGRSQYAALSAKYSKTNTDMTASSVNADIEQLKQQISQYAALKDWTTAVELNDLAAALKTIRDIAMEAGRVPTLASGRGESPADIQGADSIAALRLDYQLALTRATRRTSAEHTNALGLGKSLVSRPDVLSYLGLKDTVGIYDVYGRGNPSSVAFSQNHSGAPTAVYIEDQPLVRGDPILPAAIDLALTFGQVRLLQNNYDFNDFGDTHSIMLINDSLRVQSALTALAPKADRGLFSSLMQLASKAESKTTWGEQGQAEGDTVESTLDAARRVFLGPNVAPTLKAADKEMALKGGTCADPDLRALLDAPLKELQGATKTLQGKLRITLNSGGDARKSFADFAALFTLSPMRFSGMDAAAQAELEALVASNWDVSIHSAWDADRNKADADRTFSDQWLDGRRQLLLATLEANSKNSDTLFGAIPGTRASYFSDSTTSRVIVTQGSIGGRVWFGDQGGSTLSAGGSSASMLFGEGGDDTLIGGDAGDVLEGGEGNDVANGGGGGDTLRGGAGADQLNGGAGRDRLIGGSENDTLDGGADDDVLSGGAGNDTYKFSGSWGNDVIDDHDGSGSILMDGSAVNGSGAEGHSSIKGRWVDKTRGITYTVVRASDGPALQIAFKGRSDTITIQKWKQGDLGISLSGAETSGFSVQQTSWAATALAPQSEAGSETSSEPEDTGSDFAFDFNKKTDPTGQYYQLDEDGNFVADGASPDADDVVHGALLNDRIRGGGGNDALAGMRGDDTLSGDDGDDLLMGGFGEDVLYGGAGNDLLYGSAVGDMTMPRVVDAEPLEAPAQWPHVVASGMGWLASVTAPGLFEDPSFIGIAWPSPWLHTADGWVTETDGNYIDGGEGNDSILSGTGNDLARGGGGDDMLIGMKGDDALFGDSGNDRLYGDSATDEQIDNWHNYNDTKIEDQGRDTLDGGAGNDGPFGLGNDDALFGGDGDDRLYGDLYISRDGSGVGTSPSGGGNDLLDGGAGNDQLFGDDGDDQLFGGADNDTLMGDQKVSALRTEFHGSDYLDGQDGDDELIGGGGADTLIGGQGDDRLFGDDGDASDSVGDAGSADWLEGGEGKDSLSGGSGDDTLMGGGGDDVLEGDSAWTSSGRAGNDQLDGGEGNDRLSGLRGDDTLSGGAGNDTLTGGDGADVLSGGAGVDLLSGGEGNDTYVFSTGDLAIQGGTSDSITDGAGNNNVVILDAAAPSLVTAGGGKVTIYFGGAGAGGSALQIAEAGFGSFRFQFSSMTMTAAELVARYGFSPLNFSDSAGRHLTGGFGNDEIKVDGLGGTVRGGGGNDRIDMSEGKADLEFETGDGADQIIGLGNGRSGGTLRLSGSIDATATRLAVDAIGNVSLILLDTSGADIGDSISFGRLGIGGVTGSALLDGLQFTGGPALSWSDLTGRGAFVVGSEASETSQGTSAADALLASAGYDTLMGGAGTDVYYWGRDAGRDRIVDADSGTAAATLRIVGLENNELLQTSRNGDDLVIVSHATEDTLQIQNYFLGQGAQTIEFEDGSRWASADVNARLASLFSSGRDMVAGTENDDLYHGGDGDDSIDGRAGNDSIDGGGGNDALAGGAGDDTVLGGSGNDLVYGDAGNDVLAGGSGKDTVSGGGGNDRLSTDDGDRLEGGLGNDIYQITFGGSISLANATYVEDTGGLDTLRIDGVALADFRLFEQLGDLYIAAGEAGLVRLGPNTRLSDMTLVGRDGSMTLAALADRGDGTAQGGGGGSGDAQSAQWTPQGIEWVTRPQGPQSWVGTSGKDLKAGSAGNDTLQGQSGDDWLSGGSGDDSLVGGDGADTLSGGRGNDTLEGGSGYDAMYAGAGNDQLRGRGRLFGGEGDDTLDGSDFSDVLDGGSGNDVLRGYGGSDTYMYGRGYGNDTILGEGVTPNHTDFVVLGPDILPEDLAMERQNGSLLLTIKDTGETLFIEAFFAAGKDWILQLPECNAVTRNIVFADGTEWDMGDVMTMLNVANEEQNAVVAADTENISYRDGQVVEGGGGNDMVLGRDSRDQLEGGLGRDSLYGYRSDDVLVGGDGGDLLDGGAGDDILLGGEGNDGLSGGDGNDTLDAGLDGLSRQGMAGGASGGNGDDTYVFRRGMGIVGVSEQGAFGTSNKDRLQFDTGIRLEDLDVYWTFDPRTGPSQSMLTVQVKGTNDRMTISNNLFATSFYEGRVEHVTFSDGREMTWDEFTALANIADDAGRAMIGTTAAERFEGGAGNDVIEGNGYYLSVRGASDTLFGGAGNDLLSSDATGSRLEGGEGRDILSLADGYADGGAGNDAISVSLWQRVGDQITLRHRPGGGSDSLSTDSELLYSSVTLDLSGWDAAQVMVERHDDSLVLAMPGTLDRLTVYGYFRFPDKGFSSIQFGDGISWSAQDLLAKVNASSPVAGLTLWGTGAAESLTGTVDDDVIGGGDGDDVVDGIDGADALYGEGGNDRLNGGGGRDYLSGEDGNDTLDGGLGDDELVGGAGADEFVFARGSGQDTISSADTSDKVRFKAGITLSNLYVVRESEDLLVGIDGTADLLRIVNGASLDGAKRISQFTFDGIGTVDLGMLTTRVRRTGDDMLVMAGAVASHLEGDFGSDRLFGGAGADTISGGYGNDSVMASDGADLIQGGAGNDSLDGGSGDDVLEGGVGADLLTGGDGNDTFMFELGFGADTITANDANVGSTDTVRFGAGISASDLEVDISMDGDFVIRRRGTDDVLTVAGDYQSGVVSSSWIDRIEFADGTVWTVRDLQDAAGKGSEHSDDIFGTSIDDVLAGGRGDDMIDAGAGNDTILSGSGDDTVFGGLGRDSITGGLGDDSLSGETRYSDVPAGEGDTLDGGAGRDTLIGDVGDDLLMGGDDQDFLDPGAGNDTLQGGEGNDSIGLSAGVDTVVFNRGDGKDDVSGMQSDPRWPFYSVLRLGNGLSADTLTVRRVASYYKDYNDQLEIGFSDGSDKLILGAAYGGAGLTLGYQTHFDEIRFADGRITTANLLLARGTLTTLTATAGNRVAQGTFADEVLLGGALSDTLIGGAGADWLSGDRGADRLEGGDGDDNYLVDDLSDAVVEIAGEGIDSVVASVNWTLQDNVERLAMIGDAVRGTGNALANELRGNALNNRLDGGLGADTMRGSFGDDTYVVDSSLDVVEDVVDGGTDTVESSVTWTLGADLDHLTLVGGAAVNGTGNALSNRLTGNGAANRLDGKAGADTMAGGGGDDVYVVESVGDTVIESAGGGTDTIESSVSLTLSADIEKLVLTGTTALNGTGNVGNNVLNGNSGANRLDGGAGVDTMTGGAGNDTYIVDNSADVIVEATSGGTDKVEASTSYVLAAEVEQLLLSGTGNLNATGNASNNTLTGNAGNNRLDGGAGNDTMIGGEGDDTYVVSATTDVITEQANGGTDTVESGITYTLGSNVERLVLTGSSAVNGTGNGLANRLTGNGAADTLNGGAGDDTLDGGLGKDSMVGGAGNDQYWVSQVDDVVTEAANEGTDSVLLDVTYTLGNNVENLTLNGGSAINATGNALANVLTGNNGANSLSGAAGNDTLDGAGGNDTLTGGAGADGYVFGRGYGSDTIVENDATTGVKDFVSFGANIAKGDITFQKSGNALLAKVNGTSDVLTLQDWYLGSKYHVEEFRFGDGTVLTDTQAQSLVSAMAAFTASGTTSSVASTSDTSQRMPSMAVNEPTRHMSF